MNFRTSQRASDQYLTKAGFPVVSDFFQVDSQGYPADFGIQEPNTHGTNGPNMWLADYAITKGRD